MSTAALRDNTDRLLAAYDQAKADLIDALDEMPDGDLVADRILRRAERLLAQVKLWGVTENHVRSLKRWTAQLRERKARGFTDTGRARPRRFGDFGLRAAEAESRAERESE